MRFATHLFATVFMKPERWQQVEQLYQAALKRDAGRRAAFLAEACTGDEALRREVESLLRYHERAEDFIEAPALEVAARLGAAGQSPSLAGRQLGPYHLLSLLGTGGMGEVYRARDTRLEREVAVKVLPAHLAQDPGALWRFEREAKTIAALSHPNILAIYDVGTDQGVHFAVMELLEGETLHQHLRHSALSWREAVEIGIAVAEGLAAVHARGIIHRDLKPENIFLTSDGQVKILDFGIARVKPQVAPQTAGADLRLPDTTAPGMVIGTVNYMSPEQLRGEKAEAPSDLFSLGCVLYEMVTERRAFARPTTAEAMAAVLADEPPTMGGAERSFPPELERVIRHCLEKHPRERPQSARDLASDLRAILVGDEVVAARSARPAASFRPAARLRLAAWMTMALVALLAGVAAWRSQGPDDGQAIDSLAVLPLANASGDPDLEYLSDGITESLIKSLSQLSGLRVMAHKTVSAYKGREVDPRQVGKTLRVRAVVTGRLLRQGERLVIQAELVDAADGSRLWGEQYERPLADVLTLEEEVARAISAKLRSPSSSAEQGQLAKRYTDNTEAYQFYLKGRYHYFQHNRPSQEKALDYFQQAIARDPQYALAYTGVAEVYADFSGQYLASAEAMPKAKQAALRAIAIDDRLAEAHHALAIVKWIGDWDWAGAEAEFKRALDLNPNAGTTYAVYADFLVQLKRFDEALVRARRGEELDPLTSYVSEMVSKSLFYLRQYDQSIGQSRKTLELNPNYVWAHMQIAQSLVQQGRSEEAIAELHRALEINRHDALLSMLGYVYAVAGRDAEAGRMLAELEEQARRRHVSATYRARVYAGLGEKDRALALLRQAYQEHSDHVLWLNINPFFDSLRSDPRFADLLRRVGLAP